MCDGATNCVGEVRLGAGTDLQSTRVHNLATGAAFWGWRSVFWK
jgi:hypothetical protein